MNRLRSIGSLALLALSLAPGRAPAAEARWRALERIPGQTPVQVRVEGKARVYFRLGPSTLEFEVRGPSRLKIVSRAEIPRHDKGPVSYRVRISENGAAVREQNTESAPAKQASLGGGDVMVCKSRTFTWAVPEGVHRLRVSGDVLPVATLGAARTILVRLLVSLKHSTDVPMVSLTPVKAFRSVTVAEGEKLIPYYSVAPGKPVRLRVVGPTELELMTRLDFDSTMRGVQPYRIEVWEAGRKLNAFDYQTTKAASATYQDLPDRIPSKMDRATLQIGGGTHDLTVELTQPARGSAEIHVRIPQPLVGAEE
jgi:hypothetical protein